MTASVQILHQTEGTFPLTGATQPRQAGPSDHLQAPALLVVDDEAIYRDGLEALIEKIFPAAGVWKSENAQRALYALRQKRFDLVLIDIGLRTGMTGFELLKELRQLGNVNTNVPVLIVSGREDQQNVQAAFRYGANGFVPKGTSDMMQLKAAIAKTLAGETFTPEGSTQAFLKEMGNASRWDHFKLIDEISTWTDRQREIALWKYWGVADKVIARNVGITEGVIRKHAEVIFHKLGVSKRAQFMVLLGDHAVKQHHFWPPGKTPKPPKGIVS